MLLRNVRLRSDVRWQVIIDTAVPCSRGSQYVGSTSVIDRLGGQFTPGALSEEVRRAGTYS